MRANQLNQNNGICCWFLVATAVVYVVVVVLCCVCFFFIVIFMETKRLFTTRQASFSYRAEIFPFRSIKVVMEHFMSQFFFLLPAPSVSCFSLIRLLIA